MQFKLLQHGRGARATKKERGPLHLPIVHPLRPFARGTNRRRGAALTRVVVFLVGFALLLWVVGRVYLIPALNLAKDADPPTRRYMAAVSWLVLAIVLIYVFVGLTLTFRLGRFFFPRARPPRVQTKYVDAWAEAGKRFNSQEEE